MRFVESNARHCNLRVLVGGLCLAVTVSRQAQASETLVTCSSISAPSAGEWWVEYESRDWWFNLTATRTFTSGSAEGLTFTPTSAVSVNENAFQKLMWTSPQGIYNCYVRETSLGNGLIEVDWIHRSFSLGGSFNYVHNGEDCVEDYTETFDPYNEEPPSSCPMYGTDGTADDMSSEVSQGGDWSYLCGEFGLPSGYYDVYVDDVYQETIACD